MQKSLQTSRGAAHSDSLTSLPSLPHKIGKKKKKKHSHQSRSKMNAESEFLFPYFQQQQSFFPLEQVQVYHPLHKSTARSNIVQTTASAYNMGREGDLFKDLDPIMEEPVLELDPMTVVSMISSGEDITTQSTNVSDISSIQSGHLLSENSTSSEYYSGGESDLFKAPVSVMEESILGCDPMTLAISKISCGEDVISAEMIEAADIKSFQNECLFSELSYEWKELMEKSTMCESSSKALDIKIPAIMKEENLSVESYGSITGSPMQKSVSSWSLSSMEWIDGEAMRSNFVDFQTIDFGAALGIKSAFSEGIIQNRSDLFDLLLFMLSDLGKQSRVSHYGRLIEHV